MIKINRIKSISVYILMIAIVASSFRFTPISAEETNQELEISEETIVLDKVYNLEINKSPNYSKIKEDIISTDVKYIAYPDKVNIDIALSEVIEADIDYSSYQEQSVDFVIQRYTESKNVKTKIDEVQATVKIQFVDTTAPEITLVKEELTIEEGSDFDSEEFLKQVTDNSFDEVELNIEDNVDVDTPGEYKVTYTAIDSSNNESSKTLNVTVEPEPEPEIEEEVVETVTTTSSSSSSASSSTPAAAVSRPAPVVVASSSSNDIYGALNIINSHRSAAGLHPLSMGGSTELAAANLRAAEASGFVSHTRPDGRSYRTAFTDVGLGHGSVIEVLVYAGSSAADKVNWWMNSPTHRNVLMRSNITHIALGASGKMWAGIVYN